MREEGRPAPLLLNMKRAGEDFLHDLTSAKVVKWHVALRSRVGRTGHSFALVHPIVIVGRRQFESSLLQTSWGQPPLQPPHYF